MKIKIKRKDDDTKVRRKRLKKMRDNKITKTYDVADLIS